MENQSSITVDPKQFYQTIGVGFFACITFFILDSALSTILTQLSISVSLSNFYLYALSQYLRFAILLVILYFFLIRVKKFLFQNIYSLPKVIIILSAIYVGLYVFVVFCPFLYNSFIQENVYFEGAETYYQMLDSNSLKQVFIIHSISLLKIIALVFMFLKEIKLSSKQPINSTILDKD